MSAVARTVRLRGQLGERFGTEFKLAVSSPAEAVSALLHQLPGFEEYLMESKEKYGLGYAVFVGERNIEEKELADLTTQEDIVFVPELLGSKNAGTMQVILGAVLVVVGIFLIWTPFGAPLIYAGVSLMVMGIITMLSPQPKDPTSEDEDKKTSYAFQGPVNTSAQGGCVPVFYGGPMTIGSAIISAGIIADDEMHVPTTSGQGGGGQTGGASGGWISQGGFRIPLQTL